MIFHCGLDFNPADNINDFISNFREISAFTNVSWIPTLLPSSVLGNLSNSPSTCFVSSDGKSLRVYQVNFL